MSTSKGFLVVGRELAPLIRRFNRGALRRRFLVVENTGLAGFELLMDLTAQLTMRAAAGMLGSVHRDLGADVGTSKSTAVTSAAVGTTLEAGARITMADSRIGCAKVPIST